MGIVINVNFEDGHVQSGLPYSSDSRVQRSSRL